MKNKGAIPQRARTRIPEQAAGSEWWESWDGIPGCKLMGTSVEVCAG